MFTKNFNKVLRFLTKPSKSGNGALFYRERKRLPKLNFLLSLSYSTTHLESSPVLNLLRSLVLSTLLSFIAPLLLVGGILTTLYATSFVPGIAHLSHTVASQILTFLAVFGSGYPVQGILIICFAFALVGSLFDLFNFLYVYQGTKGQ
jgi:hypothetical protein